MLASLVMPTVCVLPLMLRVMVSLVAPMVRVLPVVLRFTVSLGCCR